MVKRPTDAGGRKDASRKDAGRKDAGRKSPVRTEDAIAEDPARARLELDFDRPALLGSLFGQFDQNLITLENRLGVYIAARGNRVAVEGEPAGIARARDVLTDLYGRLERGMSVDAGDVEAAITMSADASTEGLAINGGGPPAMIRTRRKTIIARTAAQAQYIQALGSADVIFALGPAGTGKTYLAVAQAVSQLVAGSVDRLILSRPAVEAGERLGFLPGDMKEKVDPYLRPLYDALYDMLPSEQVERRIASGEIEIAPLAFMRGRTLAHAFVILDEAQNTTPLQMKMFLTRFGEGSRMVVCGDPNQVDLPDPSKSGLADAVGRLNGIAGLTVQRFTSKDVVRHPIVGKIVDAYEGPEAPTTRGPGPEAPPMTARG
jgi:phosphate starvation-inducible PhoH-like protein